MDENVTKLVTAIATVVGAWQAQTDPFVYNSIGGAQPYSPRKLNSSVLAVPVNNPSSSSQTPRIVQIDQPPPIVKGKLNPQFLAVPVSNPPFTDSPRRAASASIITTAWQPPDPQPTLRPKLPVSVTAVPVNNPPFSHSGRLSYLANVLVSWQPPDPPPVQRTKLNPATEAVTVNNPPFSNSGRDGNRSTVFASWQPEQPLAQRGPFTPSASPQVDNPSGASQVPRIVKIDRPPPILPGKLNPSILNNPPAPANNPPFSLRRPPIWTWTPDITFITAPSGTPAGIDIPTPRSVYLTNILTAWQPPDPQPILRRPLPPSILAVQVDNPPFSYGGRKPYLITVVAAWQPPDPPPTLAGKLNPSILNNPSVGDNPSGAPQVPRIIQVAPPPPILPGKLNPALLNVQVNDPPFTHSGRRPYLVSVIASWQAVDQPPILTVKLPQAGRADSIGQPSRYPTSVWYAWQAPDPQPVQRGPLNPALLDVPVNNPSGSAQVLRIITLDQPAPILPGKLNPSILNNPPAAGDNPPFTHQGRNPYLVSVIGSWQPPDPQPQVAGKLPIAVIAVTVNNPPFSYGGRNPYLVSVIASWQAPDPQPVQRGPVNPSITAVTVNNPPFTNAGRLQRELVLTAWQPPDPDYVVLKPVVKIPQSGPTPPPPTGGKFTVSGPDVRDLFGPVGDVSWNWDGGTQKRTV